MGGFHQPAIAGGFSCRWISTLGSSHRTFVESQFNLRLSHYPPVTADANQFGIAPHSDANFMTFLAQSDVPGLQVRSVDGTWLDMPYIPGSFAVNAGDTLHRWSNGRFLSTPHRALPPTSDTSLRDPVLSGSPP